MSIKNPSPATQDSRSSVLKSKEFAFAPIITLYLGIQKSKLPVHNKFIAVHKFVSWTFVLYRKCRNILSLYVYAGRISKERTANRIEMKYYW